MKVTLDPAQTGLDDGLMLILTINTLSITINIELLRAGLLDMQLVSEEVSKQVTTSPFSGVLVKVVEFVPELIPFTFH